MLPAIHPQTTVKPFPRPASDHPAISAGLRYKLYNNMKFFHWTFVFIKEHKISAALIAGFVVDNLFLIL